MWLWRKRGTGFNNYSAELLSYVRSEITIVDNGRIMRSGRHAKETSTSSDLTLDRGSQEV
jgi:hypothetical protein